MCITLRTTFRCRGKSSSLILSLFLSLSLSLLLLLLSLFAHGKEFISNSRVRNLVLKCGGKMEGSEARFLPETHEEIGSPKSSYSSSPPPNPDVDRTNASDLENSTEVTINKGFNNLVLDGNREDEEEDNVPIDVKDYDTDGDVDHDSETDHRDDNGSVAAEHRSLQYPVRPDAEDCSYYLRTGTCKYGSNCKFNHPVSRRSQGVKEKEDANGKGQLECKFYSRTGGCKFGKACKYTHTRGKASGAPVLELNFLGLPIRLGEKECPFYMRTGSCKYGANCRFNHPDPAEPPSGFANGGPISQSSIPSWTAPRTLNETSPFVPMIFSPNQGVAAHIYAAERSMPPPPALLLNNLAAVETSIYAHHQQQIMVEEFPERPGQPECSYFLKTGDCKYRSHCKYHHPKNQVQIPTVCTLSEKGLPLRPDQNICTYYNRYGICKFGPACKFDHPINHGSASVS